MRNRGSWRRMLACALCLAGPSFWATNTNAQQVERKAITKVQPEYSQLAKRLRLQGAVKIQIVIGTDGIIKDTKVVGGNPVLVESTLEALKKWKYAPAATETTTLLEFNFHPEGS